MTDTPAQRLRSAIHALSLHGAGSRDEAEALGRLSYYLTDKTADRLIEAVRPDKAVTAKAPPRGPAQGVLGSDGFVHFARSHLQGVNCEVHHGDGGGDAGSESCGVGVIIMPTGQPRVVVQVKHIDGSSLTAVLLKFDAEVLIECLEEARDKADALAEAAMTATKQ